jgi:phasin family protein
MIQNIEQFAQINKAAFDSFQALAMKSILGFEKLAELNIQAAKSSVTESTDQIKALMSTKDAKAFADLAVSQAQPAADKATAYAKHVYEISSSIGTEFASMIEKQFADGNKQLNSAIDLMTKNAPAGSEGFVTFVKSAVSSANTAYDQVTKATKQAVEMTEANFASVTKSVPKVRKAA